MIKLTLGSSAYIWQFIPVAANTFTDSGTGSCSERVGAPLAGPVSRTCR